MSTVLNGRGGGATYPERHYQYGFDSSKENEKTGCGCYCFPGLPLLIVDQDLSPVDQGKGSEHLWLDLDRDVKVLDNSVDAERDGTYYGMSVPGELTFFVLLENSLRLTCSPQEHH